MTSIYVGGVSKYEDIAAELMERLAPDALVLIVLNGNRGHGAVVKHTAAGLSKQSRKALGLTLYGIARDLLDDGT